MSKKIVILERVNAPSDLSFRYCFWADVPAARQSFYANATATSAFKNASAAELLSLQTGTVLETTAVAFYPAGTPIATIQADLIAKFNDFQDSVTNQNQYAKYGSSYDGTLWTVQGVA